MIGIYTVRDNTEHLDRIEQALRTGRINGERLTTDDRAELEADKRELQAWFRAMEQL